ncbi:hypothetical protein Tco_0622561 [Tanacetum coccineum]
MEWENSQNNALAKVPMLKLGEYEMWEIRIKQYLQSGFLRYGGNVSNEIRGTFIVIPPNWVAAEYGSGACYFSDQ